MQQSLALKQKIKDRMPYECHYTHNINGNILVKGCLIWLMVCVINFFVCSFTLTVTAETQP